MVPAADAAVTDLEREPIRFAADALATAPPGAQTTDPHTWPALVPNCTAAYLNASIAAAAPTTAVVRVEVPSGRALSLRGCSSSSVASMMGHVRIVLAMGRSSALALDAWDVTLGGVTIEGPAGNANAITDALVVVHGGSRIVASSVAGARPASSDASDDVHALSVVAPDPGASISVSGLGIVVMEGSIVRAVHDGAGVLYASACGLRAEPALISGPPSLSAEWIRVVVTNKSSVEASTTRSGAPYDLNSRRAHAATIQALQGARVKASWVVVAVLAGSTVVASGDDSSSAAGGIGVNGRQRRTAATFVPTTVAVSHVSLVAAGPGTTIRVNTKGDGLGSSAMGAAAAFNGATASMTHAALYLLGPDTTVRVSTTGGGFGASVMGVAAYNSATASMTDAAVFATGQNTTVAVHVTGGSGFGTSAMGVAAYYSATAAMTDAALFARGPDTTVVVHVNGGGGYGASAMGVAAYDRATAAMTNVGLYAVGYNTTVAVLITGGGGYGASAMGVAATYHGATASITNATTYARGPDTTVAVHVAGGGGFGASAMGVAATYDGATASITNAAIYAEGHTMTVAARVTGAGGFGASAMGVAAYFDDAVASMTNAALYAMGHNTTVTMHVVGGSGFGASAMGVGLSRGGTFDAAGIVNATRCAVPAVEGAGAPDIAVFDRVPNPGVTFADRPTCTHITVPALPNATFSLPLPRPVRTTATHSSTPSGLTLTRTFTPSAVLPVSASESNTAASASATVAHHSGTRTSPLQASRTAPEPAGGAPALPPLPVAAVDVAAVADVASASSTTAVSGLSLNPAVGTQPGKVSALRNLIDCDTDGSATDHEADPSVPPVSKHPLRFAVDAAGRAERYNAGIVLGAFLILAGAAALVAGVAAPVRLIVARSAEKNASFGYIDALSWCRFPGLLALPLVALLPGAAEAAARMLSSRSASTTPVARAIAALGVVTCVAAPVLLACVFRLRFRRLFRWSVAGLEGESEAPSEPEPTRPRQRASALRLVKKQLSRRVDAMVLVKDKEWLAAPSATVTSVTSDAERTHALMRHYGMFFDVYRGKAPWFLSVELFFVVATSVASGLQKSTGCSALAWTLAVLYTGLALAFAVIRPHAVRLDRVLYGLLSFAQAAAAVFGAAAIELAGAQGRDSSHSTRARTGASFFLSVVSMSAGAVGVYELGKVVYQQVKAHRAKKRAQMREAIAAMSPTAVPLLDMGRLAALDLRDAGAFMEEEVKQDERPAAVAPRPSASSHAMASTETETAANDDVSDQQHDQPEVVEAVDLDEVLGDNADGEVAEAAVSAEAAAVTRSRGEEQRRLLIDILGDDGVVECPKATVSGGCDVDDLAGANVDAIAANTRGTTIVTAADAAARRDQIGRILDAKRWR